MKHWFKPDMALCGIAEIDPMWLKSAGIRCVFLDLDNTLAPWDDRRITPDCENFIGGLRGAGLHPIILSNNRPERVRDFAERIGVDYEGKARKPLPFGFLRAQRRFGYPSGVCAMVGDQLMTDIWGANMRGMMSVLVNPFCAVEWKGTKYNRLMERWVMKIFGIERKNDALRDGGEQRKFLR